MTAQPTAQTETTWPLQTSLIVGALPSGAALSVTEQPELDIATNSADRADRMRRRNGLTGALPVKPSA
jgi:hypothetical protein